MTFHPRLHRILAAQPNGGWRVDAVVLRDENQFTSPRPSHQRGKGERAERKDFHRRTRISNCAVRQAEQYAMLVAVKHSANRDSESHN